MSEVPGDRGQQPSSQEAINRRAWSKERQLRAAAVGTAVVILVLLGFWLGGKGFGKHETPAGEASPPGTFRATAQQLKTLTIETVALHGFVSEELTEGKIAVNGESRAAEAAQKSLDVVHHQLELGSVNYLALVGAEQTYQQAVVGLVQARANRYADTAALFQALGGSISPPASLPAAHP